MSQRAAPPMIMQPILPDGDLKVARWTTGAVGGGAVVVGAPVVVGAAVLVVDGTAVVVMLAVGVDACVVTVTVFVPLEPQPASAAAVSISRGRTCRFIAAAYPGGHGAGHSLLTHRRRRVGSTT